MENLSRKRPNASTEAQYDSIMNVPQAKRSRPSVDFNQLSSADRQALERAASILQKPVSELFDERSDISSSERRPTNIHSRDAQPWTAPTTFPQSTNDWQTYRGGDHMNSYTSLNPTQAHDALPGPSQASQLDPWFNLSGGSYDSYSHTHVGDTGTAGMFGDLEGLQPGHPESWSNDASFGSELWRTAQTEMPTTNRVQDRFSAPFEAPRRCSDESHGTFGQYFTAERPKHTNTPYIPPPRKPVEQVDSVSNDFVLTSSDEVLDSDEGDQFVESDSWDDLQQLPSSGEHSRVPSTAESAASGWSLIPTVQKTGSGKKRATAEEQQSEFFQWVSGDPTSKKSTMRKQNRRGPFQDKQLQEQTKQTRRRKACVRCRMQRKRCWPNVDDPDGECLTCRAVSNQKIHTQPCLRYKITECTLFRIGKAPGMEFTFRWPVMKLRDISDWADSEVRTIFVKSDVCPVPLELTVRRFVPIAQDSLQKGWMDGKVKKFKSITPFAIVNMGNAAKDMREYVNTHVFQCMDFFLQDKDALIRETYAFARRYMLTAPEEEGLLLGNFFRLWFAIRRTATQENIVGGDTIDMEPETRDTSYPLFGKIPLPPVMVQQLDMVLTLGLLNPLRKKVLEDFHRMIVASKPKSWMTAYLITFMFLHSCAALSAENYQNARKHGLRRRYAMPAFISDLHHGSNVFLSHYHYLTKPCNPFKIDWRKRHSTPFADMSPNEIQFLIRTSNLVKERKDQMRIANAIGLYEDDVYFVSQMYEDEWSPRDTVIDYDGGTVGDVPLWSFYKPKS